MKSGTIKTFLEVHTWTGLAAGLLLFVAFYTGSMTVFMHELELWDSYTEGVKAEQTLGQAQRLIDLALMEDPDAASSFRLYPSSSDHPGHSVYWFKRLEDGTFETNQYRLSDSGSLSTAEDTAHLASFIYRLHYTAGLPSPFGLYLLGFVCLIYGVALVSGLIVFLPNWLRDLFIVRGTGNNKRFWLDAHNVVGVISLPWHFMFAWSSAVLALGIVFLAPFQFLVFEEDLIEIFGDELGVISSPEASGSMQAALSVKEIVSIAENEVPGIKLNQLRFTNYQDANGTVSAFGHLEVGTLTPNANVTMNVSTGQVLNVSHPAQATLGATFYNGLIALHYVSFGGFTAKWIYFFLGLAGAFLFFSGNLLWIETRRKRRQFEQPAATQFLAKLTVGTCIGCMAGVSASFLASRGFAEFPDRADWTEIAYYAVFLVSIVWAFSKPVAVGARDLLYTCALFTILIPVFDFVLVSNSIWINAFTGHWPLLIVDFLALIGALLFFKMGRSVEARANSGESNSVWSKDIYVKKNEGETVKV